MEEVEVIDATVPDHSGDENYWAQCFIDATWSDGGFASKAQIEDWFRRALATGARQALIDVSLIEPCNCLHGSYPEFSIDGQDYRLTCPFCDLTMSATSIEELRIAWNARMQ